MVKSLIDRDPPHSIEAEMALIGSMLLDPTELGTAEIQEVKPESFYAEKHEVVWRAINALGNASDLVSLMDRLKSGGYLDMIGGLDYLDELASCVPSAANAPYYAGIVANKARARQAIRVLSHGLANAYSVGGRLATDEHSGDDLSQLLDSVVSSLARVSRVGSDIPMVTLDEAWSNIDARLGKEPELRKTGCPAIDDVLGGLPKSGLLTVIGHPSGGKSTWLLGAILAEACSNDRKCIICSYEMDATRVGATLLSIESGQRIHDLLNTGNAPSMEQAKEIAAAMERRRGANISMVDVSVDAPTIKQMVATEHARSGPGVVVIDYIQNLPGFGRFLDSTPKIEESMRIFRSIARDFGWLVACVSQPDKAASKHNLQPTLADAKGSSEIQQASDFAISVWRPHQHEPAPAGGEAFGHWQLKQQQAIVSVVKNKYGSMGAQHLALDTKAMRFSKPSVKHRTAWGMSPEGSIEHERR